MGSAKGRRENLAERTGQEAVQYERQQGMSLADELAKRKAMGGFEPGEKENFLRRATSPVTAAFSRGRDELERQRALQGGYMPGYSASVSRIGRGEANLAGEASLGANVELAQESQRRYQDLTLDQLKNRMQMAGVSLQDAELLTRIASQDKDTFDKIQSIAKSVGGFAGAWSPSGGFSGRR